MTSFMLAIPTATLDAMEARGEFRYRDKIWRTDRFAGPRTSLAKLADGGALYLVSVSMLGFVKLRAVLEQPSFRDGEWVAHRKNKTPVRDVRMHELSFVQRLGMTAIDKRYARLLRTPQPLTPEDELALAGGVPAGTNVGNLKIASRKKPRRVEDLDAVEQKQLVAAGRGHDGKALPATARLAKRAPREPDSGESFAGYLQILAIKDERARVVYDVFVCSPDSGAVFTTRTTKIVAELIQGGIQCKDPILKERLRRVLR